MLKLKDRKKTVSIMPIIKIIEKMPFAFKLEVSGATIFQGPTRPDCGYFNFSFPEL